MRGELDVDALWRAIAEVVARHDQLRVRYTPARAVDRPGDVLLDADVDLRAGPVAGWRLTRTGVQEHVLTFTAHHIAIDGWSASIVASDLSACYRAVVTGSPLGERPAGPSYPDFVAWQEEWLGSAEFEALLDERAQRIAGVPPLELPLVHRRPDAWSAEGDAVEFRLPAAVAEQLKALSRACGTTPFAAWFSCFAAVLGRVSGQADFAIGTPVAGRDRAEWHSVVGLFADMLAVRVDVSPHHSFTHLLASTSADLLAASTRPAVPFDCLVERVHPPRESARHPLFQVLFAVEDAAAFPFDGPGLHVTDIPDDSTLAEVDLTLSLRPAPDGGMTGRVEYPTALFDRAFAEGVADGFAALVADAVADPSLALGDLGTVLPPSVTAAEASGAEDATVVELFERQAAATPDAVAVISGETVLTYAELLDRVRRFSVPDAGFAGLAMHRDADLVVGLLGVLRSGAACVWLDPRHPAERLRALLDGAEPITRVRLADDPGHTPPALRDVAYVAYTSGSTGEPRGVLVEHGALSRHVQVMGDRCGVTTESRIALLAALGFDVSIEQILVPLLRGAAVVVLDPRSQSADQVLEDLGKHQVSIVNVTPMYYRELVDRAVVDDERLRQVSLLNLGGDVVSGEDVRRWRGLGLPGRVACVYGPTETTITCTAHEVPEDAAGQDVIPIGRPLAGTGAYVLDEHQYPVPVGTCGELVIGGDRVAQGYRGRPAATAAAFLPDPFTTVPGARMYRTGDVVRQRVDGVLEFIGRRDAQVKVRGHRVDPAEVESMLVSHPEVRAAAVVPQDGAALVAYVVPERGAGTADLRDWLRERLPAYMVPSVVVAVPVLPMTANGKLDRSALPEAGRARPAGAPPRSELERVVAALVGELLGVTGVGVHDDFFELGGHSIVATRLVSRLRDRLSVDVGVAAVFAAPTVAGIAAAAKEAPSAGATPVAAVVRGRPLELSPVQERLWMLDKLDPTGTEYLVSLAFRVRGRLDLTALTRAVGRVAAHHEVLRTRYVVEEDAPLQVIEEPGEVRVAQVATLAELEAEASRGFDLATEVPFRVTVARLGPEEHVLLLQTHHIACDGWSWNVLARDLYAAYAGDEPAPLPMQYADYAAWKRRQPVPEEQLAYWLKSLAGAPELSLATDRPRPELRESAGAVRAFALPADSVSRLIDRGRARGATGFTTLLAAYQVFLHRLSGQSDIVIGTPSAGRDLVDAEDLVGCFVNTLALRTDMSGLTSFDALVDAVRDTVLGAQANEAVPFDQLVVALRPRRDPSRTPVFQTMFQVHDADGTPFSLPGLDLVPMDAGCSVSMVDLGMAVTEHPDGAWSAELEYATSLFDASTIERHCEAFVRLLQELAEENRWSAYRPVHRLIAEQAARTPDAVAVVDPEGRLTYRQLDEQANRLAHHLDVRAGDVVGVCLTRGRQALVALLAVLRAGAVYLPLNADDPDHRLAEILTETSAVAVVAEAATDRLFGPRVIRVDAERETIADRPATAPDVSCDIAYIIHTSGSTGRPKGVVVSHRSFADHCLRMAEGYRLSSDARMALLAALTFDASMDQAVAPLLVGGAVVVLDLRAVDPGRVLDQFAEFGVTVADVTPVYYRELARVAQPADERLRTLRLMSVGGDIVTYADARAWYELGVPGGFACTYGPTEATIACTLHLVSAAEAEAGGDALVPIGRPLPGTDMLVLDEAGRPVGDGAAGELHVGGGRVALGYHGRADLTAQRFVPAPSGPPGSRLYRTGDLVRRRADGVYEFLCRADRQVKIRGFRVEPGEIESVARAHPGIRDVAVVAVELRPGDLGLVAHVVPGAGHALSEGDIAEFLRGRLPGHLVPAAYVVCDALPLTPNGKVDHGALPVPVVEDAAVEGQGRLSDPIAASIAGIWCDVLGRKTVGDQQNFFDLGGHSLLATRVSMRVQRELGVELPLHVFFQAGTVAQLADVVRARIEAELSALGETI
ncbi:amino acid adenylation domain-containing protein [Streptomyces sp. NBC_00523]|uniref:amino acid adenylation domain-containing protein n=1 Tax=unclassified Streptomyces TaxID=2593676 RepID=UPI002E823130|nr:amino acid adenylation domain-containing protein [Streptomyces sp. NBC_00523]WUD01287.1 amino acid adenylation domain-containing protein [Streptomyces sp. NBC_00523]